MFDLNLTKIFSTVVETNSITKAADALEMSKASVSRKITSLEKKLGVRLLHRTTRKLNITHVGKKYHQSCRAALNTIYEANQEACHKKNEMSGEITITCPVVFAEQFLSQPIQKFRELHPEVNVRIIATNDILDLKKQHIDLAFRAARGNNLLNLGYIARNLGSACYVAVASPNYVEQNGIISHPIELCQHKTIGYTQSGPELTFVSDEESMDIRVDHTLNVNSLKMVRSCAIDGLGIAILPCYLAIDALRKKELTVLLPDWEFVFGDLFLVYPSLKHIPKRVRLFIDFAVEYYTREKPWKIDKEETKNYIHKRYANSKEANHSAILSQSNCILKAIS